MKFIKLKNNTPQYFFTIFIKNIAIYIKLFDFKDNFINIKNKLH
jgi:hypothetical protein